MQQFSFIKHLDGCTTSRYYRKYTEWRQTMPTSRWAAETPWEFCIQSRWFAPLIRLSLILTEVVPYKWKWNNCIPWMKLAKLKSTAALILFKWPGIGCRMVKQQGLRYHVFSSKWWDAVTGYFTEIDVENSAFPENFTPTIKGLQLFPVLDHKNFTFQRLFISE